MDSEVINAAAEIVAAREVEQFLSVNSSPNEIRAGITNANIKFGII
jgi:hypothetical protein